MDQLKVFLKQCVKYRFWIACGISILLPIIGYFVGAGTINAVTTKRVAEITSAKSAVGKYTTPGIVNNQYQPLVVAKKEALVEDVDATWRKLFATQEPLLKWPAAVQDRFRAWGRKYPTDVDQGKIQSTLIDYAVTYPAFVENIYKVFKPFDYEDGTGIVVAPDYKVLLAPATYSQDSPPDLTKIWSEQERLWVVTALLDAVGKINDSVGAKDWDGAVVKQINLLEVGAATDQDQKSVAMGDLLVPADSLTPEGTAAPAAPTTPSVPGGEGGGGREAMGGGGMMGGGIMGGAKSNEVLYIKTDSPQFKTLPIKITVLVDQAKLPDYLVGLENSPMAIQVNEVEIAKPLAAVTKPVVGGQAPGGMGMGMGMGMGGRGDEMMMGGGSAAMMRGMQGGGMSGPNSGRSQGGADTEMMMRGGAGGGLGAPAAKAKSGVDIRNVNEAKARLEKEKKEKETGKPKADTKKVDQYYNVIEVTVYGQARFYLAPPAPTAPAPSTAPTPEPSPAPKPDAPKAEAPEAPKDEPKKDEAPKPGADAPKADAPKAEPEKADAPAPKP